jgi:hypothetical protein
MIITCVRLKRLDFSTVYFDTGQRVLVAKNSPAQSIADLGGQKLCPPDWCTGPGPAEGPLPLSHDCPHPDGAPGACDWRPAPDIPVLRRALVVQPDGFFLVTARRPVVRLVANFGQTGSWSCSLGETAAGWLMPLNSWREQGMASWCPWWTPEMRELL